MRSCSPLDGSFHRSPTVLPSARCCPCQQCSLGLLEEVKLHDMRFDASRAVRSQFVKEYYSIEHHQGWYDNMKDDVAKRPSIHYVLSHVPDGHNGWKGGIEEGNFEQFRDYVTAVDQFQVQGLTFSHTAAFCLAAWLVLYLPGAFSNWQAASHCLFWAAKDILAPPVPLFSISVVSFPQVLWLPSTPQQAIYFCCHCLGINLAFYCTFCLEI